MEITTDTDSIRVLDSDRDSSVSRLQSTFKLTCLSDYFKFTFGLNFGPSLICLPSSYQVRDP